jgi:NAD(P)-dependent dehydrogenase (short-subunit alcohol dehydrogenase family)
VVSFVNMPVFLAYSTSKAAVHSLTQGTRLMLASQGTTVIGVYPGPVDTDMAAAIPLAKTSAADVAGAIVDGIEAGTEEIYPDPMAVTIGSAYAASPKALERQIASQQAA